MANKAVVDVLNEAWSSLTYREREMLKLKFGLGDNYVFSNEEIGRVFDLGAARVGQLLRAASIKLDAKTKSVQPEPPDAPRHGANTPLHLITFSHGGGRLKITKLQQPAL